MAHAWWTSSRKYEHHSEVYHLHSCLFTAITATEIACITGLFRMNIEVGVRQIACAGKVRRAIKISAFPIIRQSTEANTIVQWVTNIIITTASNILIISLLNHDALYSFVLFFKGMIPFCEWSAKDSLQEQQLRMHHFKI